MKPWAQAAFVCVGLLAFHSGCALTSKADALSARYFSPEAGVPAAAPTSSPRGPALELRLGQVASAAQLDERISYRLNDAEVGFYEDRRWTEIPEAYLRRALERELFERRGLSRVITGAAATLDVELVAFEELRGNPSRARVTLTFSVRDERRVIVERSLDLEREVARGPGDPAQQVARALATTLREAVASVAEQVVSELERQRSSSLSPASPN